MKVHSTIRGLISALLLPGCILAAAEPTQTLTAGATSPAVAPPRVFLWDASTLLAARASLARGGTSLQPALAKLRADAEHALHLKSPSVLDKPQTAASGDKHDYFSYGPYWWPDPAKPGGLPYIRRDGEVNPTSRKDTDDVGFSKLGEAIETLGLAYWFTGDERYAQQAARLVRVWFLDPATRMNPNLQHAQAIPGITVGRGIGIIEFRRLTTINESLALLAGSPAWTAGDRAALDTWLTAFHGWLTTSANGRDEHGERNNHGTWYDFQSAHLALVLGRPDDARKVLTEGLTRRVAHQIQPDGAQPLELARTKSLDYSLFNLDALFACATLADRLGLDWWNYATPDGRSLRAALAYLAPYVDPAKPWPQQDLHAADRTRLVDSLDQFLRHRDDAGFRELYAHFAGTAAADARWRLVRHQPLKAKPPTAGAAKTPAAKEETPLALPPAGAAASIAPPLSDVIRDAFATSARQYEWMLVHQPLDGKMPRTFEHGKLVTVIAKDWTVGFFPGSLWYLFEATGEVKWRTAAARYTALLESEQHNTGSHDVGFILNCSYGNGYRLTGEAAYRPILLQGAASLSTRFNPTVGCIKSWDRDPQMYTYAVIIDNVMNLELLLWAAAHGGPPQARAIARAHADTTLQNHFRPDGSSFHVVDYDPATGRVLRRITHQGAADASAWARGQAWGLYAYSMLYRETRESRYLAHAEKIAAFILNHPRMPADKIPYWDFDAPGQPDATRDASAAAIMSSALFELAGFTADPKAATRYAAFAEAQLRSLASPAYLAEPGTNGGFLLKHCTGNMPKSSEVDTPLNYADYYFLEALHRAKAHLPR